MATNNTRGRKSRLTAETKALRALEKLKLHGWVLDCGLYENSSFHDTVGNDAWVTFRCNGDSRHTKRGIKEEKKKIIHGKFFHQVLSKTSLIENHKKRHPGTPFIVITRGLSIQETIYRYLVFLFVHRALNSDKIISIDSGISMLCPLKYCKDN